MAVGRQRLPRRFGVPDALALDRRAATAVARFARWHAASSADHCRCSAQPFDTVRVKLEVVQLVLDDLYFLGIASGQLFYGPVS